MLQHCVSRSISYTMLPLLLRSQQALTCDSALLFIAIMMVWIQNHAPNDNQTDQHSEDETQPLLIVDSAHI
jgi:hypothetical protein